MNSCVKIGNVLVNYGLFIEDFVQCSKSDGAKAYEVLEDVHEINKDVYSSIWTRVFEKSKSFNDKGIYAEFKFLDGKVTCKAHYFKGQRFARELTSSETHYTGRLLSVERDGLYLNKRRVTLI